MDYLGSYWIKLDQIRSNFEKAILKKHTAKKQVLKNMLLKNFFLRINMTLKT